MLRRALALSVLLAVAVLPALAGAEDIVREFRFARDDLKVSHLIGEIDVTASPDDEFHVTVTVRGGDAGQIELRMDTRDDGREFAVIFPVDEHRNYVYPELGRGSKTTMTVRGQGDHGGSWLKEIFSDLGGKRITVRGDGRGKEVWADLVVAVPQGADLDLRHGVGKVTAADVTGDLRLDTSSGGISARDIVGRLHADTGSGHVKARRITGDVNIDTGSGHVELAGCEGDDVEVDTGSGHVQAEDITCRKFHVDTGSGGVKARAIRTDGAVIDTGSGSVLLSLQTMGDGRFVIDTGSGNIDLELPDDASARITADTGSGRVRCLFEGATVERKSRNEMRLQIGGGAAQVRLDAGSGHVEVRGL